MASNETVGVASMKRSDQIYLEGKEVKMAPRSLCFIDDQTNNLQNCPPPHTHFILPCHTVEFLFGPRHDT
jgi:hypothetical protein